jgi:hypothetical protein
MQQKRGRRWQGSDKFQIAVPCRENGTGHEISGKSANDYHTVRMHPDKSPIVLAFPLRDLMLSAAQMD